MATQAELLAAEKAKNKALAAQNAAYLKALKAAKFDVGVAVTSAKNMAALITTQQAKLGEAHAGLTAALVPVVLPPEEPPVEPPVPPVNDAVILAELKDNTAAGVDKRLGPKAPAMTNLPDVWERPLVPTTDVGWQGGRAYMPAYSEGLTVTQAPSTNPPRFDYGSTSANIIADPDAELAITPAETDPNYMRDATPGATLGTYRLRTEEHSNGQVSEAPVAGWNDTAIPDRDSLGHIRYNMKGKIGRPVAVARGKINRYDVGFVLYGSDRGGVGFFGSVGTATAYPSWGGHELPAGKIPLSLAISSQNEFLLVGVHDEATGKGQIGIYWLWAGQDLQKRQNKAFPFDFPVAHPGLISSGMIAGVKLFGFFDLPIKYPTNLDCVNFSGTGTRIQGPDGNASYLNIWGLSTDAERAAFLAQNGTWIPSWGKACATSRYENKAVMIDLTPLFAGVRDQYFGSQAKYDQTAYQKPAGVWDAYDIKNPAVFPWGAAVKPEWSPVVTKVIDVPKPKWLLLSERGDAEVAIAAADGKVYFYKWADGAADGSVAVGANPVHLNHDKWAGRVNGGLIATCRGSRSVVRVDKFGAGAAVVQTVQDKALIDPVAAEVGDTHGLQFRYITVADFEGKAVRNYRLSDITLNTQGGAVFKMGPDGTATIERGGSFALPGKPFGISGSNVN